MNSLTILQNVRSNSFWKRAGFSVLLSVNKRKTEASINGDCNDLLIKGTAEFCRLPLCGPGKPAPPHPENPPVVRKCGLLQKEFGF